MLGQKLPIWANPCTFLESRHPDVTKNLFCVLSAPLEPNSHFFKLQVVGNTQEKKFGPTKFPREKTLDPPKGKVAQ